MAKSFRIPHRRTQRDFDFVRGEYVLPRKVRRWLEKRLVLIQNIKVRLAAQALAIMIGRYHTGPKVAGREFFLCRESLPQMFPGVEKPAHSEWHLRCARDLLTRIGFIQRVTPVAQRHERKSGQRGRWLKAVKSGDTFRAPKVMFRIAEVAKTLFSEALQTPPERSSRRSPEWSNYLYDNQIHSPVERCGKDTGGTVSGTRQALERRAAIEHLRAEQRQVEHRIQQGMKLTFSCAEESLSIMRKR